MTIQAVDQLKVQVLVDNVTDSLSSVPKNVTHEMTYLRKNGMKELSSACSHAGIINVLKQAEKLFPALPLYAVMGGFHLSGSSVEKIIPQTVADMKPFNLQMIIPAHCTGWRAVNALGNLFGDKVIPSAVGRIYEF